MAIFKEEMDKRRSSNNSEAKNDIMEGLMQMKDDEGNQLTDVEILDNIVSLVVAGYASTTLSITWMFYYLAMYPDILRKLQVTPQKGFIVLSPTLLDLNSLTWLTYRKSICHWPRN